MLGRSRPRADGLSGQPLVWEGWCLLHQGAIRQPERLWIGRVPTGSWALLKRLAWVGRGLPAELAVRQTMEMLSHATATAHVVFVGDPSGGLFVARIDGDVVSAGPVHLLEGAGWVLAAVDRLPGGEAINLGVRELHVPTLEEHPALAGDNT